MLQLRARMVFLLRKSPEVTYGLLKPLTNQKMTPKITILFVKQWKTSATSRTKLLPLAPSPAVIVASIKIRTLPKTGLKPHLRAFLNIFEQNVWQLRFSQTILRQFQKSNFGHWHTPLQRDAPNRSQI